MARTQSTTARPSPPKKSSRSSKKRTTKKTAPAQPDAPESFIDVPDWIAGTSEEPKIPDNITQLIGSHVAWLKSQKDRKMDLCGEKAKKKTRGRQTPLEELLARFPIEGVEATPAPATAKKEQVPATSSRKPPREMIRASQIKEELESPVVPVAPTPAKPLPKSVARVKEEVSPRPKIRSVAPAAPSTAPSTPRRPIKTEKGLPPQPVHPMEDKCLKAIERKKLAAQEKADKIKKENEEKKRRVEAKRKEQEAEDQKRRQEQIKKQEHAAEIRRLNQSPARSRIASTVNTPSRTGTAPKTPSALARAKVQLFAASSPARTPGRAPAKAAKIEKPHGPTAINTNFGSVPREPKRKAVRGTAASLAEEFADLPSTSKATKKASAADVKPPKARHDSFEAAQMKLLMEHDAEKEGQRQRQEARLLREEQERLRAEAEEEERQKKEERRRRRREEEEKRRKEEEERLEAERLQQEEEERRRREEEELRQEEKRRLEEERRLQEEQRRVQEEERRRAEEERLRAEEEEARRLAEDEDEVEEDDYENDIVTKLNQSILEDATETTAENNVSVYDMTMEKIYKPATADNYNIEDLSSGDETDDETAPRKKVPSWAEWPSLNKMGIEQAKVKHDYTDMYGTMENPDSQGIFKPSKKPRRQRGSSAQWSSPASNPTKGKSRFLAQQQQ